MMVNNNGWHEVKSFIQDNINPVEKKLFNDDLEKEEFKVLQARRRAYKSILDFVERRVEEVKNN